jgi:hypothetical protein
MKKHKNIESIKQQLQYALDELQNEKPEADLLHDYISDSLRLVKNLTIPDVINWVAYDFKVQLSHPPQYGKYLICRKDGKIHWETWNGSGWAYNHTVIRYWAELTPPCL